VTDGPVLLDTHALVWLQDGMLERGAANLMLAAARRGELLVSTVSAWEIGLLHRKALRGGCAPSFVPDPKTWFARAVAAPGIKEMPMTADIAIDSSFLPEPVHGDPGDRLLIATARQLGASLATRDQTILDYAALGHVRAIPC
jgi:PIN domain nuclease of toxin-antitoxin system